MTPSGGPPHGHRRDQRHQRDDDGGHAEAPRAGAREPRHRRRGAAEGRAEFGAGLEPVGRRLGQGAHDAGAEVGRAFGADAGQRGRLLGDVLGHDHAVRPGERGVSRHHFVGDDAEGVEVAARVHLLAGGLLGAHVVGGAHDHPLPRHRDGARPARFRRECARDTEVGQQRPPASRLEQDVLRLDVAMDQAGARRGVDGGGDVRRDPARVLRRELPLAIEPLPERLAGDPVHDEVEDVARLAGGVDGHDVRVSEPRDHARFGQEPLGDGAVDGEFGMDRLDRHVPGEGDVAGQEHHAHPAAAELRAQLVLGAEGGLQARGESGAWFGLGHPRAPREGKVVRNGRPGRPVHGLFKIHSGPLPHREILGLDARRTQRVALPAVPPPLRLDRR